MNKNNTHAHTYIHTYRHLKCHLTLIQPKNLTDNNDTIPKAINDIHSQTDGKI